MLRFTLTEICVLDLFFQYLKNGNNKIKQFLISPQNIMF
jgi:hypothetical protein